MASTVEEMQMQMDSIKAALRAAANDNVPVVNVASPAFTSHLTPAEKAHFDAVLYPAMTTAHNSFLMRARPRNCGAISAIKKTKEKPLAEFYETMVAEEDAYFRLFENPAIEVWAERCSGLLGTYATILRQRGEYARCQAVMRLYTRVIERYEAMTVATAPSKSNTERAATKRCVDGLFYTYLLIKFNLAGPTNTGTIMTANLADIGRDYRRVAAYEISTGIHARGTDNFAFMLSGAGRVTLKTLKKLNDRKLGLLYRKAMELFADPKTKQRSDRTDAKQKKKVAFHQCAMCNSTESFLNDYMKCSRCGRVFYCSKECQVKHWPVHKATCKKKKSYKSKKKTKRGDSS